MHVCLMAIYEKLLISHHQTLDNSIAFMWQSYISEHAGSHYSRVKTLFCIGIHNNSLSSLVFGTFANAPLQFIDSPRLKKKCRGEGHMSVKTSVSTEDSRSKVHKRHLADTKRRFLSSKEEALADYIRRNERECDDRNY
jgi:hypothetical protein